MPRIRTLKPELASDVKLARVSRDARYTFVLLITQADDEGLVAAAHRQLLGSLYPHDDDVTVPMLLAWVEELDTIGAVRWRSTTDGAPVLELVNWSKHQRVDNKGKSHLAANLEPFAESRGGSRRAAEVRRLDLGPRTLDLGSMTRSPRKAATRLREEHPEFGGIWELYPHREGDNPRRDASRAFNARIAEGEAVEVLRGGTARLKAYCERKGIVGTPYVMQGKRFYGPTKPYLNTWDIAADPEEEAIMAEVRQQTESADTIARENGRH